MSSSSFLTPLPLILLFSLLRQILTCIGKTLSTYISINYTYDREWVERNHEKIEKFGESLYKFSIHLPLTLYARSFLLTSPFYLSTPSLWSSHLTYTSSPSMIIYYNIQIAYSFEAFIHLLRYSISPSYPLKFLPTARGDFREMFIHHLTTNLLTTLSLYYNFTRVGCYILYIHDITDVPIDVTKMFNFLKLKGPTAVGFCGIVGFWIYWRMYVFGFIIIRSVIFETSHEMFYSITSGSTPYYYTCKTVFLTFLITLYSLHCYWLMCFYKMGKLLIFKYETHDLSEHKNGEAYELKTAEGGRFLGREVARFFDGVPYKGVVRSYDGEVNWYGIVYTDNDKEDWDEKEVLEGIKVYKEVYEDENGNRNEVLTPRRERMQSVRAIAQSERGRRLKGE
ncbi:hypothetical protein TrST_g9029 [Triparma strigata]|uniref:TLC domain-containing protein n=1 Tax=Triparma strigata TaxID=1606541 RepID=A0A9W7DW87_9STRA|nr:hypothetical protein TrST_g9029 [Triparma strigata]